VLSLDYPYVCAEGHTRPILRTYKHQNIPIQAAGSYGVIDRFLLITTPVDYNHHNLYNAFYCIVHC